MRHPYKLLALSCPIALLLTQLSIPPTSSPLHRSPQRAPAQGGGIKGGDFCELAVKVAGRKIIYPWLKEHGRQVNPPIDAELFLRTLDSALVRCVDGAKVSIPEIRSDLARSAINVASIDLILIDVNQWDANENRPELQAGMIIHEIAPPMGFGNADVAYRMSSQVAANIGQPEKFTRENLCPNGICDGVPLSTADQRYQDLQAVQWCNNVRYVIETALADAGYAKDEGKLAQAKALYDGLHKAHQIARIWGADRTPPLTYAVTKSGIDLADRFRERFFCGNAPCDGDSSLSSVYYDMLQRYYLLVDGTLFKIDSKRVTALTPKLVESEYIEYLRKLIAWLNDNYVLIGSGTPDTSPYVTRWDEKYYLFLASFMAKFVASELGSRPQENGYACTITLLNDLARRLDIFLSTPNPTRSQTRNMFDRTFLQFKKASRELGSACSPDGANGPNHRPNK